MREKSGGESEGLAFWKVEGAGNDFVLLDYREKPGPRLTTGVVRYLLDRHRGIGADGLLLIRQGTGGTIVDYRNADGTPAEFCGNGARCAAAHIMGEGTDRIHFRMMKIPVVAVRTDRAFAVQVGTAEERRMPNLSRLRPRPAALIHAGVDHWIVPVGDVQAVDVVGLGMTLRHHAWPGSKGANVTFVERRRAEIRIRTLERGVEGETLSCGSGCVAAAHWTLEGNPGPITVSTRGGDQLRVWKDEDEQYWLEGPTRVIFTGTWPLAVAGAARSRAAKAPVAKG
ncbi:MAG: diaminopimelate epimerase [Candidatus Eisenbacteria bacterium]|nr:diaminopimelate epimerase [Candidatus Latescibacterota bacterium]MBD3301830.1 diaminopimelate epimerase [Candidatus Eisenbacteria bacterium]